MNIIQYLNEFKNNGRTFRNILIFNSNITDSTSIVEIAKDCNSIVFSFYNNFVISSLSAKLRFNKNIKFVNSNQIINKFDSYSFDLVIMQNADTQLINLINKNEAIQFFITLDDLLIDNPYFKYLNYGIYKRNLSSVVVDLENEKLQYESDLKKNEEINNTILNDCSKNEKNISDIENYQIKNSNFAIINVENLVPHETKYFNSESSLNTNDGIVALSMIINNDDDFNKFQLCKDKVNSQYSNIKYYIVLNGKNTFKFFKNFSDVSFLIKSENKFDYEYYEKFLNIIINNEYQFNINKLDVEKFNDIWGLI